MFHFQIPLTRSPHPPNSHSSPCRPDRIVVSDLLWARFSLLLPLYRVPRDLERVELTDCCEELDEQNV